MKQKILTFIQALNAENVTFHITIIYLFGSAAIEKSTATSDIDIAVLFDESKTDSASRDIIMDSILAIGAETLDMPEDFIDIKILNDSPLQFQYQVISKGTILYLRDRREKELYESQILSEYMDYLYYEEMHHQAIQKRIVEGNFGRRPEIIV